MVVDFPGSGKLAIVNGIRTDTLWDLHPVIQRAEQRLYEWLGERYPRITKMFEPLDIREVRSRVVEEHFDRKHDLTFLRRMVLAKMAGAAGYADFEVDEAFAVLALRERFTLIAVTNGNADLETIGISDLFDDHVNAAMAGAAKPERPIFDVAVKAGGASAAETLHVGDHPLYDVHGAKQAGLRTAWVNRDGSAWPAEYELPDAEIAHVGELLALIGEGDE
jgi:putative hydrolase of the HAD superfamily